MGLSSAFTLGGSAAMLSTATRGAVGTIDTTAYSIAPGAWPLPPCWASARAVPPATVAQMTILVSPVLITRFCISVPLPLCHLPSPRAGLSFDSAATSCPNSGTPAATYATGSAYITAASFDPAARTAVSVALAFDPGSVLQPGGAPPPIWVPVYSLEGSYDPGSTVTLSRLSSVRVTVSYSLLRGSLAPWGLDAAVGKYTKLWSGPVESLTATARGGGTVRKGRMKRGNGQGPPQDIFLVRPRPFIAVV